MIRKMTIEEQDLDRAIEEGGRDSIVRICVFAQALRRHGVEFSGCAWHGYTIRPGDSDKDAVPVPGVEHLVRTFDVDDYDAVRAMLPLTVEWDDEKRGL